MYLRSRSLTALVSIATVLLGGCLDRPLRAINPCTVSGVVNEVQVTEINEIDLLFLVDNSNSMSQEQQALIQEIPRLVEILASGNLQDGGATDDFEPVASIQVGVITSDMGIGGVNINAGAKCGTVAGDDGLLVDLHRGNDASCPTTPATPPFLTFMNGQDPTAFADAVGCLADTGSEGCAFEMQLEAVLKALTPADSTVRFPQFRAGVMARDSAGHGGTGLNRGFLRNNSLLAIIVVTDEDDCSTSNMDLFVGFDSANPPTPAPYPPAVTSTGFRSGNLQCATHRNSQGAQYNVMERYVSGILALRPGQEDLTIFATIAGVDPDVLADNSVASLENGIEVTQVDIEALLAHPSMREVANTTNDNLIPSCTRPDPAMPNSVADLNIAFPPRRLLEVTQGLIDAGANGVVASICQAVDPDNGDYNADFGPAVSAIAARIAASLPSSCLPRPLIRRGDDRVTCEILEVLPEGETCADQQARGRDPMPVRMEDGREVCRVNQQAPTPAQVMARQPPDGLGWYYDDYSADLATDCARFAEGNRQQVRFTDGAESIPGAKFRLECLSPVVPTGSRADIGTACPGATQSLCDLAGEDLADLRSQYDREQATLVCDNITNTCQLACETDANCPGGYVCFDEENGNTGDAFYCVSPTCAF